MDYKNQFSPHRCYHHHRQSLFVLWSSPERRAPYRGRRAPAHDLPACVDGPSLAEIPAQRAEIDDREFRTSLECGERLRHHHVVTTIVNTVDRAGLFISRFMS